MDELTPATATDDKGRTLSGVGVSADDLQATIDERQPEPAPEKKSLGTRLVDAVIEDRAPATTPLVSTEPPPLAKGRVRYQELTHARDAEKARADAAEQRARELEARLQQPPARPDSLLGPGAAPAPERGTGQPAALPPSQPLSTRPEPSEDDVGTTYATYGAFVKDHHAWTWEQQQPSIQQQILQGIQAHQQQQQFLTHMESVRAKGRAAYSDFDQLLQTGPGTFVPMPAPAVQAILDHPASEHLQYQIMKNGELAQRLAQLAGQNPYAFALELVKLVPVAVPAVPSNGHQPPPPAPMQPVGTGSRSTVLTAVDYAEKGDYENYKRVREAERNRR
jgi:hypothetical protein